MLKKIVSVLLATAFTVSFAVIQLPLNASADSTLVMEDTYDSWSTGYKPTPANGYTSDGNSLSISNTASAKVTVDSGRLKIYTLGAATQFYRDIGTTISSGKVVVEYEFEFAALGDMNYGFPSMQTTDLIAYQQHMMLGNSISVVNCPISANTKYKQTIIANLTPDGAGKYYYDYFCQNLTNPQAPVFSATNVQGGTASGFGSSRKDFQKIMFNFGSSSATDAQTVYLDNMRVYKADDLAVQSMKFTQDNTDVADNQTNVPVTSNFRLTFNSPIDAGTLSAVTLSPDIANKSITVDETDQRIINIGLPTGLDYGTSYTLSIAKTLRDTQHVPMGSAYSKAFTTEAGNFLTVSSLLANNTVVSANQTGVPADAQLRLVFNTEPDPATLSGISISPGVTGLVLSVDATDGKTVNFSMPAHLAYETTYTISIDRDVLKNLNGYGLASNYSKSFTTDVNQSLELKSLRYAVTNHPLMDDQTNVLVDSKLKLVFNSEIDGATLAGITVTPDVPKTLTVDSADHKTVNLTFTSALAYQTTYTILADRNVLKNISGHGLESDAVKTFTTADSNLLFLDTFDGWDNGYKPLPVDNYSNITYAEGVRTVTVMDNRLQIFTKSANPDGTTAIDFTRTLPTVVTSGKVAFEYEFEFNEVGNANYAFPAIQNSKGVSFIQPQVVNPSITIVNCPLKDHVRYKATIVADFTPVISGSTANYYYDYYLQNLTNPDEPVTIRKAMPAAAGFVSSDAHDFKSVYFYLGASGSFANGQTLYMDNLKVTRIPDLQLTDLQLADGTAVADNAVGVSVDSQFKLIFNTDVDASTISGITVSPSVPELEVAVDPVDQKVVNLALPMGMDYSTTYTITVPKSVMSLQGIPMRSDAVRSFTTENEPDQLVVVTSVGFSDFDGAPLTSFPTDGKVCANITIKSLAKVESSEKNINLILVYKDAQGRLADIAYLNTVIGYQETQTLTTGFTATGTTQGMHCDLYVWDQMPGSPYLVKNVFPALQ